MIINEELKKSYDVIAIKDANGNLKVAHTSIPSVNGIFESQQQIEEVSGSKRVLILEMILG